MVYLDITHISPDSTFKFNKGSQYLLALVNTSRGSVNTYQAVLNNIGNITSTVRGYDVKKSVPLTRSLFQPVYTVMLINKTNLGFNLLFSSTIDLSQLEFNGYKIIKMYRAPLVQSNLRQGSELISESLYNFYKRDTPSEVCYLALTLVRRPSFPLAKSKTLNYDKASNLVVFDRYSNNVVAETSLYNSTSSSNAQLQNSHYSDFSNSYCSKGASYDSYLKRYQRDDAVYYPKEGGSNKFLTNLTRPIHLNRYRPLYINPLSSTPIVNPADGRVRAFHITPDLKLTAYNQTYKLANLVANNKHLLGGSGFMCRVSPQDYQRVHIPFAGDVFRMSQHNGNILSLVVRSNYFVPPQIHSRDLTSVFYGEPTGSGIDSSSRVDPSLLKVQPKSPVIYHILMVSRTPETQFTFTNKKLVRMRELVNNNEFVNLHPVWYEQGEEVGKVNCGSGYVIVLCNRPIRFAPDVGYMSKMTPESDHLARPVDVLVRARDNVGSLF